MKKIVNHTIPPIYDKNSKVLLLGTMPSPKSREMAFFYAHPQNRFWKIISKILDRPLPETPQGKRELLLGYNIALWDVLESCAIDGASDASICDEKPNDLNLILSCANIKAIFATGAKAASLYKKHLEKKTGKKIITLPSTSPANCAWSFERLVEEYKQIIKFLN